MLLKERPILGKEAHERVGQHEWWHTAVGLFEEDQPSSDGAWAGWAMLATTIFPDSTASLAFIRKILYKI